MRIDEGLFQGTLISMVLGFCITYTGKRKLINFLRLLFIGLGIASISYGAFMSGRRIFNEVRYKKPFILCVLRMDRTVQSILNQCLLELVGLILNAAIMITLGVDPWVKNEENERSQHCGLNVFVKSLRKYLKLVFKLHSIIIILCFAGAFSNVINEVVFSFPQYFGPRVFTILGCNVLTDRLIWTITFFGVSAIELLMIHFWTKKGDDTEKSSANTAVI